ncbi:hypothetical protein N182_38140 [Sinorhizobium sp. GL2]|nr:hypothetical protein N182_38140 [Sinorhizobium sp. GL2]
MTEEARAASSVREGTTMMETIETLTTHQPERSRAVFSNEDCELIRVAVNYYLQEIKESPEGLKYSNLYHRLRRIE